MTRALPHLLSHPHSATVSPNKTPDFIPDQCHHHHSLLLLGKLPLHIRTSLLKAQQWSHATKIELGAFETEPQIPEYTPTRPDRDTHVHVTALHRITNVPATGETGVRLWFFKATESTCRTFLLNYITLPKVDDGRLFDLNNRKPQLFDPAQKIGSCSRLWKLPLRYSL